MTSDRTTFGIGLTGGVLGLVIGLLSAGLGIAFAATAWRWFGVASAYFAFGGLAIGLMFLVVALLSRAGLLPRA
jgi:hypothetical protein